MDNPTRRLDVTFSIFQLGGGKKKGGRKEEREKKLELNFKMRKGGKWNPYVYIAYYNIFKSKSIFYLTIYGYKKKILFFETKSFFFFLSFFFLSAIKHTRSLSVERRSINTWKHTRLMSKLKRVNYKLQKFQKKKKRIRSKMFVVAMCLRDIY